MNSVSSFRELTEVRFMTMNRYSCIWGKFPVWHSHHGIFSVPFSTILWTHNWKTVSIIVLRCVQNYLATGLMLSFSISAGRRLFFQHRLSYAFSQRKSVSFFPLNKLMVACNIPSLHEQMDESLHEFVRPFEFFSPPSALTAVVAVYNT